MLNFEFGTEYQCLEISKLGECEFFLISEMSSQMIVHQPYRTLNTLQTELNLSQEDVSLASSVINDHYMTDLPLLYPPHTIALTAILLALTLRPPLAAGSQGNGGAGSGMAAAAAAATLAQAQARAAIQGGGGNVAAPTAPAPSSQGSDTPAKDDAQKARGSKVQRFAVWLADSNVNIEAMVDCTQELIAFYECHDHFNEKMTREQVVRFIKARGLDR
jgi:cyclin-C